MLFLLPSHSSFSEELFFKNSLEDMNKIMEVRVPWWHIGVGIRHCHLGRCCDPGSIPGPGNFCIPQVRQKNNNDDGNIPSQEFSFNCLHFSSQLGFTSTGGISLVRPQKTPYSRNTGKDWKQDRIVTYYQRVYTYISVHLARCTAASDKHVQ